MSEGVLSEFYKSFQQVCYQDLELLIDVTKVLKKVIQISCPIQQNAIDYGLFSVIICLHIFEGTETCPHTFTNTTLLS